MSRLEYQDFVCEIVTLKQKHVEDFADEILKTGSNLSVIRYGGEVCRAAIKAGWFASPPLQVTDVREWTPRQVRALAEKLNNIYSDAIKIKDTMLLDIAAHVEDPKNNIAPRELVYAWRNKIYGLGKGNGWLNEEAGLIDRMTTALNVYDAFSGYKYAASIGKEEDWVTTNPQLYEIVNKVMEMRVNGG